MSPETVETAWLIGSTIGVVVIVVSFFIFSVFRGQRRSYEAVEKSERKYRYLFQNALVGMLRYDPSTGKILEGNETLVRMLGAGDFDRIAGMLQLRIEEGEGAVRERLMNAGRIEGMELRIAGSTNTVQWVSVSGSFNKEEGFCEISVTDIGAQKRATEVLTKVSQEMIEAEENERRRVARELHDGVNQTLSIAKRHAQSAHTRIRSNRRKADIGLSGVIEAVQTAMDDVRRISRNLRPGVLDDLGLVAAVRSLGDDVARRAGCTVTITAKKVPRRIPKQTELTVYRIAQEALTNIEKHARARTVSIGMFGEDGSLRLKIQDDGKGFNVGRRKPRSKDGGVGLSGMSERASLAGGSLVLHSERRRGTTISLIVPIHQFQSNNLHTEQTRPGAEKGRVN